MNWLVDGHVIAHVVVEPCQRHVCLRQDLLDIEQTRLCRYNVFVVARFIGLIGSPC